MVAMGAIAASRRRGGGATPTFTFEADIINWWDPTDGVTLSGTDLVTWTDRIGGVDMAPVTALTPPQFNSSGINGSPTFDCLSAGQNMRAPFVETDTTYTFIVVMSVASSGSASYGRALSIGDIASGQDQTSTAHVTLLRHSTEEKVSLWTGNAGTTPTAIIYGTPNVFIIDLNGTTRDLYKDNALVGQRSDSGTDSALAVTHIGVFWEVASSGNENARGRIGDLIVVNRALTSGERAEVQTYLDTKYGL